MHMTFPPLLYAMFDIHISVLHLSCSDSFCFSCFVSSRHDVMNGKRINQTMPDKHDFLKNIVFLSFLQSKNSSNKEEAA